MSELRIFHFVRHSVGRAARIEHSERSVNHITLRDTDRTQAQVRGLALCISTTVETERASLSWNPSPIKG
jgi:hypothetical protein